MIQKQLGHYMLFEAEHAKIDLSNNEKTKMDLKEIEKDFFIPILKDEFLSAIQKSQTQIIEKAKETIQQAGINGKQIQNIIFTGGTSLVPSISKGIKELLNISLIVEETEVLILSILFSALEILS